MELWPAGLTTRIVSFALFFTVVKYPCSLSVALGLELLALQGEYPACPLVIDLISTPGDAATVSVCYPDMYRRRELKIRDSKHMLREAAKHPRYPITAHSRTDRYPASAVQSSPAR
ncbi:hypothetical protein N658DRAFT_148089 [Parathielavia hyrcaniae]|uniref:Uncharacterized protein n=1 Tax=Parathielavia hyrcaniae TaxID=113614 RepID=A0AAN6PY29_9PEZI|nr:hypothetical protein N658DRAFT_148089 [Parathielavia hyrcaniae]